jgi:sialic acid synthase SpsE
MIQAAADAGCDYAKIQTYQLEALNPRDPQADWLRQAHLTREDHVHLQGVAKTAGIQLLSTPFEAASLQMLRELGFTEFKIASSESGNTWYAPAVGETWFFSWPWGMAPRGSAGLTSRGTLSNEGYVVHHHLTAIPLYPTPLEAVGRATLLGGWSDHTVGLDACLWAIAHGVQVLEAHLTIPGSRHMPWDKTPADFQRLRAFADSCETIRSGVGTQFRRRWQARA